LQKEQRASGCGHRTGGGDGERAGRRRRTKRAALDRAMPDYRAGELRPPDKRFMIGLLEHAIRATVDAVSAQLPDELGGGRDQWGKQLDIRPLDREQRREVAGYLAKYATKSTEQAGGMLHPSPTTTWTRTCPPRTRSGRPDTPRVSLVCPARRRAGMPANEHKAGVRRCYAVHALMELGGLEPPTSWVRSRRSPN
jgi:hypothetical protein